MSFVAKDLRAKRYKLVADARALMDATDGDTNERIAHFDAMMSEADSLKNQIERIEKSQSMLAEVDEIIAQAAEKSKVSVDEQAMSMDTFVKGFTAMLRRSARINLNPKDKRALEEYQNAAATTSDGAGGATVQHDLMKEIFTTMVVQGGVSNVARIIRTAGGNPLDIPLSDDSANVATIVGENTSVGTGTDVAFTKTTLGAYKYTSGVILISKELLQDSAFDFQQYVIERLQDRFVRGTNASYTTGNGTTQPQGVVTAATLGKTGASGQTTSITYADLVDMEHSVGLPYRQGATWMMNDAAFKSLKKLVDGQGRPLWVPSLAVGAPDMLLGYPIQVNANMANPAASAKSLLFGNFNNFIIRQVLDLDIQIMNEVYASTGQVGLVGIMRSDSRWVGPTSALSYYANSAS